MSAYMYRSNCISVRWLIHLQYVRFNTDMSNDRYLQIKHTHTVTHTHTHTHTHKIILNMQTALCKQTILNVIWINFLLHELKILMCSWESRLKLSRIFVWLIVIRIYTNSGWGSLNLVPKYPPPRVPPKDPHTNFFYLGFFSLYSHSGILIGSQVFQIQS